MSLSEYKKKRNFKKTREPLSGLRSKKQPIFVVQEHWASHHHFDFRLEAFGTLKSWAVPKGPSTAVGEKRLAVEVEDHPIDYATFHGRIPEGEYGAGIVKIWDKGYWQPPQQIKENLRKGHLEFELRGKKLKGRWLLQRTRAKSGRKSQWLLIKRHDPDAHKESLKNLARSKGKRAEPWPHNISPQLAQLSDKVPDGTNWIHEIKFDGYRTLATLRNGQLRFFTRNGLNCTRKYSSLERDFRRLKMDSAIFDGEIVALDENGHSSFAMLQETLKHPSKGALFFYLFDLLYFNGQDLRDEHLEMRKLILKKLLRGAKTSKLIFSEHWRGQGDELFKKACHDGLEGLVSKDRTAPYTPGRSAIWQKIKCTKRQEFVIGGYTNPEGLECGRFARVLVPRDELLAG